MQTAGKGGRRGGGRRPCQGSSQLLLRRHRPPDAATAKSRSGLRPSAWRQVSLLSADGKFLEEKEKKKGKEAGNQL